MAFLVYLGGAKDHAVIPQVFPPLEGVTEEEAAKAYRNDRGKVLQDKRKAPIKEASLKYSEITEYELWGHKFPKGKPVEVANPKLIAKAKALGCFEVREKGEAKKE